MKCYTYKTNIRLITQAITLREVKVLELVLSIIKRPALQFNQAISCVLNNLLDLFKPLLTLPGLRESGKTISGGTLIYSYLRETECRGNWSMLTLSIKHLLVPSFLITLEFQLSLKGC